jgi:hypothetical protein
LSLKHFIFVATESSSSVDTFQARGCLNYFSTNAVLQALLPGCELNASWMGINVTGNRTQRGKLEILVKWKPGFTD